LFKNPDILAQESEL